MNYGYYDERTNEYVITTPETPSPWINYLGEGKFSGIISNTGGGLCFDGDPSFRRITRYKFNNLPIDRPGRYIYIRDMENGDYFSPTWQPVMKKLDSYECRHGLGYTIISGSYNGISASIRYSVPLGKKYELWDGNLSNTGDRKRIIKLFSYVEWSWFDAERDILCDWPRMIFQCRCENGRILYDPISEQCPSGLMRSFLATSLPVDGFDCSLSKFIGKYRNETNPEAVEQGFCFNSNIKSDNAVGVLSSTVILEPGQMIPFRYILGVCEQFDEVNKIVYDAFNEKEILNGKEKLENKWNNVLSNFQVSTPCKEMNYSLNCWNAYQAVTTFSWSRFISLYERGVDRGFGFRDSMQDVLGIMHIDPDAAAERIKLLLSIQFTEGDAKTVFYPASGLSKGGGRSDDHLWSVFSVCQYIKETGKYSILDETVPYADGGSGSICEHLEHALMYSRTHLGKHGFPDIRTCDWNDSLTPINNRGGAESIFVFFQMAHGAYELINLYKQCGKNERLPIIVEIYEYCKAKLPEIWDGKWFIRAYTAEGKKYGTVNDEFNKIFLNPQSWAVLSRLPSKDESNKAFDSVMKYLYTDWGLVTHFPPSDGYDLDNKMFFPFTAGSRENGGIFYHSNTWAIIALTMLGRNEDAWKCYYSSLPLRRNSICDKCIVEPYVYTQTMLGPSHPDFGKCSNSWLTGTASWMNLTATQYILGIRPDYKGMIIDPCVPKEWDKFSVLRKSRRRILKIQLKANNKQIIKVNGIIMENNYIPWTVIESYPEGSEILIEAEFMSK